jgi:hypothetical protein
LEVAAELVKEAVAATQRQIYEADEAAWRAAFRPHAVIVTEKDRPEQIFVAAIIGVERLLRVDHPHADRLYIHARGLPAKVREVLDLS